MSTLPGAPDRAAAVIADEFLELVCADEQLLTAEFEAITAEWWSAQRPTEASDAAAPASLGGHGPATGSTGDGPRPSRSLGATQWSRQRSPPHLDQSPTVEPDPKVDADRR